MAASILYLSAKHLTRLYIPNNTIRHSLIFVGLTILLGATVLGIVFGVHPPPQWRGGFRSPEFYNNLSGLFFMLNQSILMISTFLTISGSLKLLNNPGSMSLVMVSPVSAFTKFWASIGPLVLISSIPYLVVITPFIVMFLFLDPLISFVTVFYFVVVSGWSVVLCFASLVALVHFAGREKAMRISYALPFILLFLPALFTLRAEDFRKVAPLVGYWQLIFFVVSLIVLPPLFKQTCKMFYDLLTVKPEAVKEFAEPAWGQYNPWLYVTRSAVSLSIVPLITVIVLMLGGWIYLDGINASVFTIMVLITITTPLGIVTQGEREVPSRWLLAPYAAKVKQAVWLKLNLPLLLLGIIAVVVMGIDHTRWMGVVIPLLVVSMVALTSPLVFRNAAVQNVVYVVLILGCLIAQSMW